MRRFNLNLTFMAFLLSPAVHAAEEIQPLTSFSVPMQRYGTKWINAHTRLLVKNLAYEKDVDVVYVQNGEENRVKARYFGPAKDGWEVWEAFTNLTQNPATFYLDYKVNGQHYQTNNEGTPFTLEEGPAFFQGQTVQQMLVQEFQGEHATFVAAVKSDLGTENGKDRKVKVHYTFDNFLTTKVADLFYQNSFLHGYGAVSSPNAQQIEMWSGSISGVPGHLKQIEYYLSYEVDGQTHYDSNFGHNYHLKRYP